MKKGTSKTTKKVTKPMLGQSHVVCLSDAWPPFSCELLNVKIDTYCASRSPRQIPGRNGNGTPGFGRNWKLGRRSLHCDTEKITHKGSSGRTRHTC